MPKIQIGCGWLREGAVDAIKPVWVTPEIVQVDCIECGGTGDWARFHPDETITKLDCVDCKGTGRIYC